MKAPDKAHTTQANKAAVDKAVKDEELVEGETEFDRLQRNQPPVPLVHADKRTVDRVIQPHDPVEAPKPPVEIERLDTEPSKAKKA